MVYYYQIQQRIYAMATIFAYSDFRKYLQETFAEVKKRNGSFSHRFLAQKLGLATPNLILLVMQGKRNLTPSIRFKLSKFLHHTKKESLYFEHMVSFAQAKTHEERSLYYTSMLEFKRTIKTALLEVRLYEYYCSWYNPVIRELVTAPDFSGDFKTLAKRTSPSITPEQARRSVELLLELGLIKKSGKRYKQADPIVSTGPIVESVAVANFHRKTAHLAAESFDRHTRKERTITSCTVTLSEAQFQMLKHECADLRKQSLELAQDPGESTRVYQLNIQLFPVSKNAKKDTAQ
jgi:uncharacterized protein (TIGR02147 family)